MWENQFSVLFKKHSKIQSFYKNYFYDICSYIYINHFFCMISLSKFQIQFFLKGEIKDEFRHRYLHSNETDLLKIKKIFKSRLKLRK